MSYIQPGVVGETDANGNVVVVIAGNGTVGSGSKTVTTAGTRVALSAISVVSKKLTIQALYANTGYIYVGDSTVSSSNGIALTAGNSISITPNNLNLIYIDSSVNGEGITYYYEN